jgi:hypothetical protein
MDTNYTALNNRVTTAIETHLLNVKALTPNADVPILSKEITAVVFDALGEGGLTRETIEKLGNGTLATAKSQGR